MHVAMHVAGHPVEISCLFPAFPAIFFARILRVLEVKDWFDLFNERVSWKQGSFDQLLSKLRSLSYNVLDVKANEWYEDFNIFKAGTKDLEIRLINVIQQAFSTVTCLSDQPLLLEARSYFAPSQLHWHCPSISCIHHIDYC